MPRSAVTPIRVYDQRERQRLEQSFKNKNQGRVSIGVGVGSGGETASYTVTPNRNPDYSNYRYLNERNTANFGGAQRPRGRLNIPFSRTSAQNNIPQPSQTVLTPRNQPSTAIGGISAGAATGSYLIPVLGGTVSGGLTGASVASQGGNWAQSLSAGVGAGLGSALGSWLGGSLGAGAGAAATANPGGAIAGGVVGATIGGTIGGGVGGRIGLAVGNTISGFLGLPTNQNNGNFQETPQYFDAAGNEILPGVAEIPYTLEGPTNNAAYLITGTVDTWNPATDQRVGTLNLSRGAFGPVTSQIVTTFPFPSSQPLRYTRVRRWTFRTSPNGAFITDDFSIEATNASGGFTARNGTSRVTRTDGVDPPLQPEILPQRAENPARTPNTWRPAPTVEINFNPPPQTQPQPEFAPQTNPYPFETPTSTPTINPEIDPANYPDGFPQEPIPEIEPNRQGDPLLNPSFDPSRPDNNSGGNLGDQRIVWPEGFSRETVLQGLASGLIFGIGGGAIGAVRGGLMSPNPNWGLTNQAQIRNAPNAAPPQAPIFIPPPTGCGCNTPLLLSMGRMDEKLNNLLNGASLGSDAAILAKLNQMQQFAERAWQATRLQKAINALTLLAALHNAAYLSRDVAATFGEMLSLALDVVGIDDENGSPIDINTIVGNAVSGALDTLVGAERVDAIQFWIAQTSRIYQATANVVWTFRTIGDSLTNLTEIAINNTGRIGNALKQSRVIEFMSYPWLSENVQSTDATQQRIRRIYEGIEQADETVGTLYSVVAEVSEVGEQVNQLGQAREQLQAELAINPRDENLPENVPIKESFDDRNSVSVSPELNPSDIEASNGTP